ncbi:MAG: hypothetical protein IJ437_02295 [Clostridia bacterium]|nr:hypothetical protein [Clostridia bacterium]
MEEESKGFGAFFSKNFDIISKLFVYHIAMCVFGLVVSIAVEMVAIQFSGDNDITTLSVFTYIAAAFGALVYLGLIYVCMWEKGASDRIKIVGGRMKENNFKGLLFWLIANSINIFIILNVFILSFIPSAGNVHGVLSIVTMFYNAMYLPELVAMSNITWLYFVVLIPGAVMAMVSYILGIKGFKCIFPEPKSERNRKLK